MSRVEERAPATFTDTVDIQGKLTSKLRNETFGTAVVAAGSDKDDAAAITIDGGIIAVTGADNTKGVILPVVSGLTVGDRVKIINFSASTLEVYPGASDRIYPAADNGGITVAAYGFLELIVYSADGWVGNEGVIAA